MSEAVLELGASGRTLLIVEHDLTLVDFASRYLVLEQGRLVADTATPPALPGVRDGGAQPRSPLVIAVEDVSFRYRKASRPVLDGISRPSSRPEQ